MDEVYICGLCQRAYEPEQINDGVWKIKEFQGYTVDLRLQQFRQVIRHEEGPSMETIAFASPKGQALLSRMHEEVTA